MAATGISGAADAARVLLTQQSAEIAEPDRASQQPGRFAAHADGNLAEVDYGNFDMILDHFSRGSQPHATAHTPCSS